MPRPRRGAGEEIAEVADGEEGCEGMSVVGQQGREDRGDEKSARGDVLPRERGGPARNSNLNRGDDRGSIR